MCEGVCVLSRDRIASANSASSSQSVRPFECGSYACSSYGHHPRVQRRQLTLQLQHRNPLNTKEQWHFLRRYVHTQRQTCQVLVQMWRWLARAPAQMPQRRRRQADLELQRRQHIHLKTQNSQEAADGAAVYGNYAAPRGP
jgi:hypothetical protein